MNRNIIMLAIRKIQDSLGSPSQLVIRDFLIGSDEVEAWIIYMSGLVNKDTIDRDILTPLMLHIKDTVKNIKTLDYISKKYLTLSEVTVSTNLLNAIEEIKRGKCLLFVNGFKELIIADTKGGEHRSITEPKNEPTVRGPREGYVENLDVNISIIKRRLKDKNLIIENFTLGKRTGTDGIIYYIKDIANESLVKEVRDRINAINVDNISASATIEQILEKYSYSIFPQTYATERPDVIRGNILEGRVAIMIDGSSFALLIPSLFSDFFQAPDDYLHRTIVSSFLRIVRIIATIMIIAIPAIYVAFTKFNVELIPLEAVESIVEATRGIAFTPFMSILAMGLTVEFLREGGLRLPGRVGQTLSVVGGIIIGDAALRAKIISPSTLLIVGFTTSATFVLPNYEMALSIRLLSYPILVLANWAGMYGIGIGCFFILCYLCSLDSYGFPYFYFHKRDLKDIFIRDPLWKMPYRPEILKSKDIVRQGSPDRKSGASDE